MESAATHLTLTFIGFCCMRMYALIECLERDVFDERDPIYLYVACLCTELDRFCPLTPYDRAY